ncbi:MAG TPA: hypothetical protein VJU86_06445 [Pyrinomonadaceae bacterium]|nr:hypothetical protein [Pyrinomonadaceae bacterium]
MKLRVLFLLAQLLTLLFVQNAWAKDWRGIVPLHSTRADVVRKFNQCANAADICTVRIGNEDAYIVFSTGAMSEYYECAKRLPTDTVLHIEVELKRPRKMSDLGIRESQFRGFLPAGAPEKSYNGYTDENEGWVIETHKGRVTRLYYIAARNDWSLCSTYYQEPEAFVKYEVEWGFPSISMGCPEVLAEGDQAILTAITHAFWRRTFKWQVNVGRIVAGQGTGRITVDTTGAGGRQLKATVELRGGRSQESNSSFCEVLVSNRQN